MMAVTYVAVVLAVFGATDVFGSERGDWTEVIPKLLQRHRDNYNTKNAEALASEFLADGHRLEPRRMAIIGRKAIEESYREDFSKLSLEKLDKMEMTDLQFACGDGAVAEFISAAGKYTGKGVILVKMMDGVPKVSTLIYNTDS